MASDSWNSLGPSCNCDPKSGSCREFAAPAFWIRSRDAFSLVELIVVLLIMAMLSTLVALSIRGTIQKSRVTLAIETLEIFDARLRREARSNRQPITATIDVDNGKMTLPESSGSEAIFSVPERAELTGVRIAANQRLLSRFPLTVSTDGRSESYAVEFRSGEFSRWVVVLGGSGQVVRVQDGSEMMALLDAERAK